MCCSERKAKHNVKSSCLLDQFHAEWAPERCRRGPRFQEVGDHHQSDFCIKIGTYESHVNVSFIMIGEVTRRSPQIAVFKEKGRSNDGES